MIPNPFCKCDICNEARSNISALARKRSSFLLDDKNLLDFGPDVAVACQQYNVDLCSLENIWITHTHEDHLCFSNFGLLSMSRTKREKPLKVYVSEKAYTWIEKIYQMLNNSLGKHLDIVDALSKETIVFSKVKPYAPIKVNGYEVVAVETTHKVGDTNDGERAINYLFTNEKGIKLLYATDTGIYTEDNLKFLSDTKLDYLIMEATFGSHNNDTTSHLNAESFVYMVNLMKQHKIIAEHTQIFATHINHKHDLNHERYQKYFDEQCSQKVIIASDGMNINK